MNFCKAFIQKLFVTQLALLFRHAQQLGSRRIKFLGTHLTFTKTYFNLFSYYLVAIMSEHLVGFSGKPVLCFGTADVAQFLIAIFSSQIILSYSIANRKGRISPPSPTPPHTCHYKEMKTT